ncbi:MAG: type IV pilus twitching motility protein PilT [Bacteriovoracaceae bacterium]|nr:type IV pili twitching motility protein PilT [Halobacteriovoraceae bacterium]MDP7321293.1 type IV pilus twitching motility protein PilT [Bacteriovoracaceae bacterium]
MAGNTKTNTKANTETHTSTNQGSASHIQIQQLFKVMVDNGASDLHITIGSAPGMRISGEIVKVKIPPLTADDTKRLVYQILTEAQRSELEKNLELDFSFGVKGLARFRANCFYSKGAVAGVFRQIPSQVPDFDALGLPNVLLEMTDVSNGLLLVTGPTGSGKSTTLASIIDRLNKTESGHILTLEDPVEFVHQHKMSIVNQREVGVDTLTFGNGLRSLLRQDPDIVLVGELRDVETIEAALEIAETGHLVFGTLHTNSTIQTISRIINVFPSDQQEPIRTLLSFVLQGVVAQQLIPKKGGGRVLVQEILRMTPAIKNLVREDKLHQVYSQMQINQEKTKMVTMNQSIKKALDLGHITREDALSYSNNPEEMQKILGLNK